LTADEALRRSNARFRSLARAVAEMVWVAAPDGQAVDMSGWRDYTGQTVEAIPWLGLARCSPRRRPGRDPGGIATGGGER
jgi:PAS domain-containing protein